MTFLCDKNLLQNAIGIVSKALPQKSPIAAIEGILFVSEGEELKLTCTDLSITIETKIPAEISTTGSIVLPGKLLAEIIRRMPEGRIQFSGSVADGVVISSSGSKMSVSAFSAEEYPSLPEVEKNKCFTIGQALLKNMINQTIFASAIDESRPILTGCLFEIESSNINVVALDGYRLALRSASLGEEYDNMSAIIPSHALAEISKVLADTDAEVTIYLQKSYCMIDLEHTKIITRLIEGEFIKYKPIIPKESESIVTVSKTQLLESIDRAWLMVKENSRNNYIVLKFIDKKMIITSRSDTGNAYEELPVSGNPKEIEIGFNPRYFVDCLKNLEDEFITLNFTTALSPSVIKPIEGDKYLYLILPVRI